MSFKKFFLLAVLFLSAHTLTAQLCSYTITLTGNDATCLQNDTLKLNNTTSSSSIKWYRGTDSVAVSTLSPYTIAGKKNGNGSGSTPGLFNSPQGVCVDRYGNMYICDANNHRVQKWAPNATEGITVAGGVGADDPVNDQQVRIPVGIIVDTSGNLYVCDNGLHRVQKWAPGALSGVTVAGSSAGLYGSAPDLLYLPGGIWLTSSGNLYVADEYNNRVQLWLPNATEGITVAGGNGEGSAANQLSYPEWVFVDSANNLYVSDGGNARVQKWADGSISGVTVAGGNGQDTASNQFIFPMGIAVANNGTMFICDPYNYRVQKWLPGAVSGVTIAGGNGVGNKSNQLSNPSAIWLDSVGSLLIADPLNNRVQKWIPDSSYGVTVAGSKIGSAPSNMTPLDAVTDAEGNLYVTDVLNYSVLKFPPGSAAGIVVAGGNGRGNAANQLANPTGLFVDSNKVIYVCDQSSHRVQKWLPGAVSGITVAGGNGFGSGANQLYRPGGLFVNTQGDIYIADGGNNRVQKWLHGAVSGITVAGGNGLGNTPSQLWNPLDVFVDKTGDLYVCDTYNSRIQKWAPDATEGVTVAGGVTGKASNQLNGPQGIFIDDSSNLLIADFGNHRVQQWAPGADTGITIAGNADYFGSLYDQFLAPYSVYKDKTGNLIISDARGNARVQKWPRVPDSTYVPTSPGIYKAVITGVNPVCIAESNSVSVNTGYTYQFVGDGNWSSSSNWINNTIPPAVLLACSKVMVIPPYGSSCIIDTPQTISSGANITVQTGSNLIINGNLIIH